MIGIPCGRKHPDKNYKLEYVQNMISCLAAAIKFKSLALIVLNSPGRVLCTV